MRGKFTISSIKFHVNFFSVVLDNAVWWKRLWLFIVVNNNKKVSFSFVSRCSHVWCRSRRFNCILLVFFRRWGRLVMRDLIKHDALLWLVVFQQLWLVHFDPCCSLSDLLPQRSAVARLSCCCVFWSWASMLLEFLFHYPCWCLYESYMKCMLFTRKCCLQGSGKMEFD